MKTLFDNDFTAKINDNKKVVKKKELNNNYNKKANN